MPPAWVIELDKTSNTYVGYGADQAPSTARIVPVLRGLLPTEPPGLDLKAIKKRWPEDTFPRKDAILNVLADGVEAGNWKRDGAGRKGSPHTYWVPEENSVSVPGPQNAGGTESR